MLFKCVFVRPVCVRCGSKTGALKSGAWSSWAHWARGDTRFSGVHGGCARWWTAWSQENSSRTALSPTTEVSLASLSSSHLSPNRCWALWHASVKRRFHLSRRRRKPLKPRTAHQTAGTRRSDRQRVWSLIGLCSLRTNNIYRQCSGCSKMVHSYLMVYSTVRLFNPDNAKWKIFKARKRRVEAVHALNVGW